MRSNRAKAPLFINSYRWLIATRYILPSRKHLFTSIISLISLIGIFLGVFALIVVMAVMNGFRAELLDRILGLNGHLVVQSLDGGFNDYASIKDKISALNGVKFVLPVVEGQALAQSNSGRSTGVLVRGLREQDLMQIDSVAQNIKAGNLHGFDSSNDIAIGSGLANILGVTIGGYVRIISPEGDVTPFGVNPRVKAYRVRAIFSIGMSEYDSSFIFMPLEEAQKFFNYKKQVPSFEIFVRDPDQIDTLKPLVSQALTEPHYLLDWRTRNQAFFSALAVERNVMFLILSLIILVAALNIISGLVMLTKDKTRAIAILRTMGATSGEIMQIFMLVGMVIGALGTFLGFIMALLTCANIQHIQNAVSWLFGVDVFNPELYFLSKLPARLDWGETLWVLAMSLFLSFLAAFLPAWRASKLDPVKALRYE